MVAADQRRRNGDTSTTRRSLVARRNGIDGGRGRHGRRAIGVTPAAAVARNYTSSTTNRPSRHRGVAGDLARRQDDRVCGACRQQASDLAAAAGRRRRRCKLLATTLDHELPRWAPDSSSLIYFVPSLDTRSGRYALGNRRSWWRTATAGRQPQRWRPQPRRQTHRVLSIEDTQMALVVIARDGSSPPQVRRLTSNSIYEYPRWSPNDQWIAFQRDNSQPPSTSVCSSSRWDALRSRTKLNAVPT